jgi:hypothetical protein
MLCDEGDYSDFDGLSQVILTGNMDRRLAVVHVVDDEDRATAQLIASAPGLSVTIEDLQAQLAEAKGEWKRCNEALRDVEVNLHADGGKCARCGANWPRDDLEQHNKVKYKGKIGPCPAKEVEGE